MKKRFLKILKVLKTRARAYSVKAMAFVKKYPIRLVVFTSALIIVIAFIFFVVHLGNELRQRASERGERVRVGFSADWEYGSRKKIQKKLTNQAPAELTKVVEYFNTVFQPEIVIGGGDYIESSGVKVEKAKIQLREINDIFKKLDAPRAYVLGNHDLRVLPREDVMSILEMEGTHGVYDIGDWRLVLFDTNANKGDDSERSAQSYSIGYTKKAELEWLDWALDTDRPTVVFSHHTPVLTITTDDIWRENIENAEQIRTIFERHPNVIASISGHTPRPQESVVNGIRYIVSDTLVSETGIGAFATIELYYNSFSTRAEIVFEHYGMRRETYGGVMYLEKNKRERMSRMIRAILVEKYL